MPNAKHREIVQDIAKSNTDEEIDACRASIKAYVLQRGGVSQVVNVEEDELHLRIALRHIEIHKEY